jgi:RNA polymerase sigma-70 factor (ECF subfamily)
MIYRVDRSVEQLADEILVMDCQSGRVRAMEMLVSRWQERLWRYALRLVGDTEAAWDITQESWLGIIRGIRRLNDPARFRSWAYRIVTNKSRDWIRKTRATKQTDIGELDDRPHKEKKDTGLGELLEKLDMKKKVVLSLYYFEQLSVPEIGAALRIPNGTVKSRLYNARNELKELWQEQCE